MIQLSVDVLMSSLFIQAEKVAVSLIECAFLSMRHARRLALLRKRLSSSSVGVVYSFGLPTGLMGKPVRSAHSSCFCLYRSLSLALFSGRALMIACCFE